MNSKRLRLVLLGILGSLALIFVLIWVVGMSALSEKSRKMVELKLESKVVDNQLNSLAQAKSEIEQYSYFKDVAKTVIPDDKNQAKAVLDITRIARESGISIQSISFPSSSLGVGSTPTTTPEGSSPGSTATSTPSISQAKPVSGITGLYSLELTITPETGPQVPAANQVTFPKMLDFLERIERNRRTAQITQVNIQPQSTNASSNQLINFTLTVNIFIRP